MRLAVTRVPEEWPSSVRLFTQAMAWTEPGLQTVWIFLPVVRTGTNKQHIRKNPMNCRENLAGTVGGAPGKLFDGARADMLVE